MIDGELMAYPLKLHVSAGAWQLFAKRKKDPAFKPFAKKVFERDQFICQFCGFIAKKYQDVVNLDHNYRNNKLSNMVTSCCFCTQCLFVESVGVNAYGGGTIIYLPEISQAQLNNLSHVLFCAIINDQGYKATAQSIYRTLKFRSKIVEKTLGNGTSLPEMFARLLIDMDVSFQSKKELLLEKVRLLPSQAKFSEQVVSWADTALEGLFN